jgi:hypothetical protein
MTLSTTFSDINTLDDISFIAGSTYTLKFTILDQSGSAIDLSDAICTWSLASYGTDFSILTKTCNLIAINAFEVILSAADTQGLSGKFSHQPSILFSSGLVSIPSQGIITIIKRISS